MVVALFIAILAVVLGGDSPFMIPKLDNYVKTHVVDDSRKDKVIVLLKDAKKKRKEVVKKNKKLLKELTKLSMSREAKQADFDQLMTKILEAQTESQQANILVTREAQKNITSDEWVAIEADVAKSLEKSNKKKTKQAAKDKKRFLKWENLISKTLTDEEKRKQAIESVDKLKTVYLRNYKIIQDELLNENSIMYQYNASETELTALQEEFISLIKEIYQTDVSTYFKLVELSTPEEWKKIK